MVSRVTVLDQSQPVWLVEVGYDIAADEGLLTVRVAGSLNTASGAVRAHGAVTDGFAAGAAAKVTAQNVDAARSRFKGTIRIDP